MESRHVTENLDKKGVQMTIAKAANKANTTGKAGKSTGAVKSTKTVKLKKATGSLKLKGKAISPALLERSAAGSAAHAFSMMVRALQGQGTAAAFGSAGVVQSAPPLPQVFPCKAGDVLNCTYHVNAIVAVMDLFWAPDENADGQPDRLDRIGHSEASNVAGSTPAVPMGWSFLIWDFAPANQNPWTAQLSISVNDGPPQVFSEVSGAEGEHHQAGILIWAAPHD
jgi:hypothetical protein